MFEPDLPLTFKNLDKHHSWPLKHKHWQFEILEDEHHLLWVNTHDLRKFYEKFPKDKELKDRYRRSLLYIKDIKTYFISVKSMEMELRKSRNHHSHNDVLIFLNWFESHVSQVAAKKRLNIQLNRANEHRDQHEKTIQQGPIPMGLSTPQMNEPTVPLTAHERWLLEQESGLPRRVFRVEALPPPPSWKSWARELWQRKIPAALSDYWQGRYALPMMFMWGIVVLFIPTVVEGMIFPEDIDWTSQWRMAHWAYMLILLTTILAVALFVLPLTRSFVRLWQDWRLTGIKSVLTGMYALSLALGCLQVYACYDQETIDYWWAMVTNDRRPANVYADPYLGRIVMKGAYDFGSAEALEAVANQSPKLTLVQLEGPGGFVTEGLRMRDFLLKRGMDTVVLNACSSACGLAFSAGRDRYLGPESKLGFHSSSGGGVRSNETNDSLAEYYRTRQVEETFIKKSFEPEPWEMWYPSHEELFKARFATQPWSERKPWY